MLQLPNLFVKKPKILYASGEETQFQVAERAKRLGIKDVWFIATQDLEEILSVAEKMDCELLIVDSVQTVWTLKEAGVVGGLAQVKSVTERIVEGKK